ncbi:MAG: hypothetical protein AB8G11_02415 [Saprospiraceae bacterium]
MKINSIFSTISRIQYRLANDVVTDESIPLQLIEDTCHSVRLSLFKKNNNKSSFYQKICCIPVECETVECDGMVLENIQVINIPEVLTEANISVSTLSVEEGSTYLYLGKNKSKPMKKSRLMKQLNQRSFTLLGNNKLVIYDDEPIEFLCVSALFVDPYDERIIACSDITSPRKDAEYPIPSSSLLQLEDIVYRLLINRNTVNETDNNSKKVM